MSAAPTIFDPAALRLRAARAQRLGPETFLLDRAADDLAERLSAVMRDFAQGVDVGTPTDAVRRAVAATSKATQIVPAPLDGERLAVAPESADLAVSALALQFVNDLPGMLAQIRRTLMPDGLFLAALVGGETLTELRQAFTAAESEIEGGASPRVAPFADLRDMGTLLQRAGFALPVIDSERITVRYANVFGLMQDLRRMGATNAMSERRRTPLRRTTLMRMAQIYSERFSDSDGRLRATFEIIWLSGWAPHESQQKPLRPGSAQRRLADALGVPEQPAGDKAR